MEVTSFITKDGSSIREFAHTGVQSLAEATVEVGRQTEEHYHRNSEELYLFTSGMGRMRPKTPHKLWNTGENRLVLLCCCAPPYRHDDTVLTGR